MNKEGERKWHPISKRIPMGLIRAIAEGIHNPTVGGECEYMTTGGNIVKAVFIPNPNGTGGVEFFEPED